MVAERPARGVEEPLGDGNGSGARVVDHISDPRAEDAYDDAVARIGVEQVPALLSCLNARERMIIRARYGLEGTPRTLRELAEGLALSAERVRQIEQCALERMRERAEPAAS